MISPTVLGGLSILLSLTSANVIPRQVSTPVQVAPRLASIENLAIRTSNGQILTTNMQSPILNAVDPVAKTSSPAITIQGARGLSGIDEISPDVFAVIGDKSIYKVDFTSGTPTQTLLKTITEASNLNGLCKFTNETILVADAGKGVVYKMSFSTGDYSVALQDSTMAPTGGIPFGIDGVIFKDGIVWYTNIFKNSFHRVPVDVNVKPTGAYETIWSNLMGDDMCFGPSGKLYVATNSRNSLVEVDTENYKGTPKSVATVRGSTSCKFGKGESDKNTAYVGGAQGVWAVQIS